MKTYQLSEAGRKITWESWKRQGGCGLSDWARGMAVGGLQIPEAHWKEKRVRLGDIEDVSACGGRELARFAVEHLKKPAWAVPYKENVTA